MRYTLYCTLTSVKSTNHDCGDTKPFTFALIARLQQHVCAGAIRHWLGRRWVDHGRCGCERHDIRISCNRHDDRQCHGYGPRQRRVQRRRQRRGRCQQLAEPIGQYADQSLAQRFDAYAGTRRPLIADSKKPRSGGAFFFASSQAATSSLPAASCISRHRASPTARALRAPVRWRQAPPSKDPESAFSPRRFRRQPLPRRSISR